MNKQPIEQLLRELAQPEPSAELDSLIMNSVKQQLALENYYKADFLLASEPDRLDATSRYNLQNVMSAMRTQYGAGFDEAYNHFVAQQNAAHPEKNPDTPELGLG